MMIPGRAPSTPARHEPSRLLSSPFSNSCDSSPKYQTLPSTSCAKKSSVSSVTAPPALTVSCTTMHVTPAIRRVSFVTVTVSVSPPPTYVPVVPGSRGYSGIGRRRGRGRIEEATGVDRRCVGRRTDGGAQVRAGGELLIAALRRVLRVLLRRVATGRARRRVGRVGADADRGPVVVSRRVGA